jgi:hypothetical protein
MMGDCVAGETPYRTPVSMLRLLPTSGTVIASDVVSRLR